MSLIENSSNGVVFMTSPNIKTTHAFTTRFGGVSQGIYSSLNLGLNLKDDPAHVRENYSIVCRVLGFSADDLVHSGQVHGSSVRVVTRKDCGALFVGATQEADALITNEAGVALMVFVGDCLPILLHDPVRRVIGVVHSGWRGTAADIAGAAVEKMADCFGCPPADIRAAIGPCISRCCFETDEDVPQAIRHNLREQAESCIEMRENKFMVDLKETNRILLSRAGVRDITISDECTSCLCDKYWSHRKTKGRRGSQTAIIMLNA